jgi:DNA topoisomerase VI subunit B
MSGENMMQTVPEVSVPSKRGPTLTRTAFTTDRALEFFSESELTTQMGYGPQLWPLVLVKELIDNALDACETGNIAPEISIVLEPDSVTVTDNGPGIPSAVIEKSLDYHVRISDKRHYVSPTRGQLGNALKCVWAAPYVANGAHSGLIEVQGRGLQHRIEVNLDRINEIPILNHTATESSVKNGTSVKIHWGGIASCQMSPSGTYYQMLPFPDHLSGLVRKYAAFNPHASFHFGDAHLSASNPQWEKWRTDRPTSAHWYQVPHLRNLIAAYITAGDRPVRDFVAEFAGLSGTQIRQKVLAEAGITGTRLMDLVTNGDVDLEIVARLLEAMRANSKPIKPGKLGVIGSEHLEKALDGYGAINPKYSKVTTFDEEGLPLVLEIAFGINRTHTERHLRVIGLNWSPVFKIPSRHLTEALNDCYVQLSDATTLIVHLAQPRFAFSDHGKGALAE